MAQTAAYLKINRKPNRIESEAERRFLMNRPPPYFPQEQLSPPDPNRYRKFKLYIALAILAVLLLVGGASFGIFYLIKWLAG